MRDKGDWFNEFGRELLQSPKLINKIDKCPKKVGHVVIWYFTDRSVKYTLTPSGILVLLGLLTWNFHYTIGIDHLRSYAKFQFGQLRDGYFIRPVSILPKIYAYWFYIILHSSSTHHKLVTVVRFYLRSWFFQRCWQLKGFQIFSFLGVECRLINHFVNVIR